MPGINITTQNKSLKTAIDSAALEIINELNIQEENPVVDLEEGEAGLNDENEEQGEEIQEAEETEEEKD